MNSVTVTLFGSPGILAEDATALSLFINHHISLAGLTNLLPGLKKKRIKSDFGCSWSFNASRFISTLVNNPASILPHACNWSINQKNKLLMLIGDLEFLKDLLNLGWSCKLCGWALPKLWMKPGRQSSKVLQLHVLILSYRNKIERKTLLYCQTKFPLTDIDRMIETLQCAKWVIVAGNLEKQNRSKYGRQSYALTTDGFRPKSHLNFPALPCPLAKCILRTRSRSKLL